MGTILIRKVSHKPGSGVCASQTVVLMLERVFPPRPQNQQPHPTTAPGPRGRWRDTQGATGGQGGLAGPGLQAGTRPRWFLLLAALGEERTGGALGLPHSFSVAECMPVASAAQNILYC